MLSDVLNLVDHIKKISKEWNVKVAHFSGDGSKIGGDSDIIMQIHLSPTPVRFFFQVTPIEGYTFLRYPVNPGGVIEELGRTASGLYDSNYFRYIPYGRLSANGLNNVIVPFIVYGYKTSALTEMESPVGPKGI